MQKKNGFINFEIKYELNNGKLDTLFLVNQGDYKQKDFGFLLNLYKSKYRKYKLSKRIVNVFYKSNHKITQIYWDNYSKWDFTYSKIIYKSPCSFSVFFSYRDTSKKDSRLEYHIHAEKKRTKRVWIFEVDVKKLNDEFVKYELINYEFKDGIKVIELQKFEIINPIYHKKQRDNEDKYKNDVLAGIDEIDTPTRIPIPPNHIKIKYFIKKPKKIHKERKINSLKKEQQRKKQQRKKQQRKNKNDI